MFIAFLQEVGRDLQVPMASGNLGGGLVTVIDKPKVGTVFMQCLDGTEVAMLCRQHHLAG
jgi:hypothetical protein